MALLSRNLLEKCIYGECSVESAVQYAEEIKNHQEGKMKIGKLGLTDQEYEMWNNDSASYEEILTLHIKEYMNKLADYLDKASQAYYNDNTELISNFEYDKKYDTLLELESRFGYTPENSPTKRVGYVVESTLKKEIHEYKALSLDKTKDREALKNWLGDKMGSLGWKLDGLTVQLTYDNGKLSKAVTRGNGEVGENVTHNAKYFEGVPQNIPFTGHLVVRGEALISYSQFERINRTLPAASQYKNPRNLASGSVRQLDAKEAARRHVEFKAFELVYADGAPYLENPSGLNSFQDTYATRFRWLSEQGFDVVEYFIVDAGTILETIEKMEEQVKKNDFPSDGLVLSYNDVAYGKSLGTTGKFPKHSIAFKWADETQETTLLDIEWSASRTGLINPVAVFEPVELEGTTVSRASVHNVSVVESLKLGVGDSLLVYKANMIIPQIAENKTKSGTAQIPNICPVCGGKTEIRVNQKDGQSIKTLYCTNPDCQIKHIKKFAHFAERDRMNISGLSESTVEKLVGNGYVKEYRDLYHLDRYRDQIISMDGFGEKSYEKLAKAIDKSRKVKLENLIAALGIANVGRDAGKKIAKALGGDIERFNEKLEFGDFLDIEDVGEISNQSINEWYQKQKVAKETGESEYFNLLPELKIELSEKAENTELLSGKTFVITGDLHLYENRKALTARIEELGGKVSSSVSKKTSYLINNDILSGSSKNKKAKELNIPILTEENFNKLVQDEKQDITNK